MKYTLNKTIKNNKFTTLASKQVFGLFLIAVFSIIGAQDVKAGLLSKIGSLFAGDEVSAQTNTLKSTTNSQNMPILQPALNIDPNPNKDISINPVNGNTLVTELISDISVTKDYANTQINIYTVRDGDTLSEIAQMFKVSINTIVWANDIRRSAPLKEGQVLVILPVSGIKHKVSKGETLKSIVADYKADLNEVLNYNDLSINSKLFLGQEIIIPDGESGHSDHYDDTLYNPAHDTNGPYYPGYYARPVVGGTRSQGLHGYNGIDIAGPVGTPIYASASGVVIASVSGGWSGGYGNFIIISHDNNTQTLYAHNSKNLVKTGQFVEQGEQIATMGITGKVTGSHLHFEIRGARNPF
jgi:murein DD-endopeptidase MepM/ murein hydrolase activator NlpD